jgi:hypothetical protein
MLADVCKISAPLPPLKKYCGLVLHATCFSQMNWSRGYGCLKDSGLMQEARNSCRLGFIFDSYLQIYEQTDLRLCLLFTFTQVVLYNMVQCLLKLCSRTRGYTALDTHKEGFYKCPIGKIDIAMSLSEQVRLDRSAFWLADVELTH